jgi:hypothetical protein
VGLFGGFLSFFFWTVFFSFSSIAFSLVYCRCTKGRLTLLIKLVTFIPINVMVSSSLSE